MTVSLVDLSIEDHGERYVMKLNIFKSPKEMPPLPSVGQPMVVSKAKVRITTPPSNAMLTGFIGSN